MVQLMVLLCYGRLIVFDTMRLRERLFVVSVVFFFQAEDGIRDLVRSRGLGDVYKRQLCYE